MIVVFDVPDELLRCFAEQFGYTEKSADEEGNSLTTAQFTARKIITYLKEHAKEQCINKIRDAAIVAESKRFDELTIPVEIKS